MTSVPTPGLDRLAELRAASELSTRLGISDEGAGTWRFAVGDASGDDLRAYNEATAEYVCALLNAAPALFAAARDVEHLRRLAEQVGRESNRLTDELAAARRQNASLRSQLDRERSRVVAARNDVDAARWERDQAWEIARRMQIAAAKLLPDPTARAVLAARTATPADENGATA